MTEKANGKKIQNSREAVQSQPEQIEDILRRVDALPTLDNRSEDDILGYG